VRVEVLVGLEVGRVGVGVGVGGGGGGGSWGASEAAGASEGLVPA
jgi:hypothetical protein